MGRSRRVCVLIGVLGMLPAGSASAAEVPDVPRVESVVPADPQPHAADPAVIWYDDFDGPVKAYTESEGPVVAQEAFGAQGRSMLSDYPQGSQGVGNRKVFFGDSPIGKVVRRGETFDDVSWRIYVKHQHGWTGGGPAKLSRATSMVSPRWNQAMIAHAWSPWHQAVRTWLAAAPAKKKISVAGVWPRRVSRTGDWGLA